MDFAKCTDAGKRLRHPREATGLADRALAADQRSLMCTWTNNGGD
jgi:hypothetical protein